MIMRFDHQQFQRTLGVWLAIVFATTARGSLLISLMPTDPEGLVGQDLDLWCSVSNGSSPQDAFFTIVYRNKKPHHRLPANDTIILNATTVMLTISNLTEVHDRAMVFCWAGGQSKFQILEVGQTPPIPDIFYARYQNWENFVFKWKLKPKNNGFKTKYTAWFKSSSDIDFTPCDVLRCDPGRMSTCIAQNEDSCTVPTLFLRSALADGFIYFKVNGTNKAGNATSETVKKSLHRIVEPGPVNSLELQIMNGSDGVSYRLPDYLRILHIQFYVVSKESVAEEYDWLGSKLGKKLQHETFPILKPYTAYRLSMCVKYELSPFRSNWTNVTFTSHEEVPSQAPNVCRSCFERESDTITVHFQPLTREQSRGNVLYTTRLLSLSNGSSVPDQVFHLNYSKGAAAFKLSNVSHNVAYHLGISASTSSGSSPSTYVDIPTMTEVLSYPTNCTVMRAGDDPEQFVFRWNNFDSSSQRLKTYTVFWCNGSMNRLTCDDPLEWMEVDSNQSSASVKLMGGHFGYIFGIAATAVNNRSSGIQWTCYFYSIQSVGPRPYIRVEQKDETAIEIQLSKPPHHPKKGFVYGYNLYYAEEDEKKFVKIYLDDKETRGIAVIDGLASGKSYLFKAESLALAGPSDLNITTIVKLPKKPFSLSTPAIAGIVVSLVIIVLFAVVGVFYCIRCPFRLRNWIKQLEPCTPEVVTDKGNYSKEYPTVPPDYCAICEIPSEDNDHPDRQNNEEGDTTSDYSAVKPSHGCVSLSGSKMPISVYRLTSVEESPLTNILPPLKDCLTKSYQRLQVVSSSLSDRCDSSSDAEESDNLTSSHTSSSDSREHAFLVPDNSQINATYAVGRTVSSVVEVGDPSEMDRLLPSVTKRHHPKPSLQTTTENAINTLSANARGLDVFESVLPQTIAMPSSVLPSVQADDRTGDSEIGSILPIIGTDLIELADGDVGVLDCCCEVSSTSEEGSSGTEDRILSTGASPVDPESLRSSLSGYSSRYDGTEPSYVASSTNVTPMSNPDDEGIYL